MSDKKLSIGFTVLLAFSATTVLTASAGLYAQTETVLYSFSSHGSAGVDPCGGVVFDAAGNLYGTTNSGGVYTGGTAFELSPAGGGWNLKGLHSFGKGLDGLYPEGNVIFDAQGNLYGTTHGGGANGFGTAYELSPKAGGAWTEKVLHSFGEGDDARYPNAGVILDAAGDIFGTADAGGPDLGGGIVFELIPSADGGMTERSLHNFGVGKDGNEPVGSLVFDAAGNLYGATAFGGPRASAGGTIFELTPTGAGWVETVLYNFSDDSGASFPLGSLIFDAAGNLYGLSYKGGSGDVGTVFELSPGADGVWTSTVLHSFSVNGIDGYYPQGSLVFDASGNLYGTTSYGGADNDGVVFELTPEVDGSWTETLPLTFDGKDGQYSCAGVIFDGSGNLYGTTSEGGPHNFGEVFEITPPANAPAVAH
jgi:uncharacterized repeat protein (TIGR03803 family)